MILPAEELQKIIEGVTKEIRRELDAREIALENVFERKLQEALSKHLHDFVHEETWLTETEEEGAQP